MLAVLDEIEIIRLNIVCLFEQTVFNEDRY